ncbi:adenosylmethionine--8-amino-7-oxononanoate transaminase [Buchnera aphidicola (Thelaxes californica)]|uniref:Adenosylmethionine-8-amino-7-oxononanoate aminotransferase n=1 Tax=Buchnera aphidicola (Thelaxes californica) TaxID=1315998 RepID=A0A4D6YBK5_9GAMM|nr:adenosylmethionine--8-amino-7-oxononanoate transaminase [Buchnera aphidicola]QCI26759.1 adenosylmethionine--8-amino-7-oxononanoate transaminase [Buchnera aphidicola (Thelaxes californica)]
MKKIDLHFDKKHIWHPYSSMLYPTKCYPVISAKGMYLTLEYNKKILDGMSSWWAAIHGYNNKRLNDALKNQIDQMSHVMFGGITHIPAIKLCKKLLNITNFNFECVFLADSGSIAIEVSMKMAIQYWKALGIKKKYFLTIKKGYHGDTFFAMSISDPNNSFHNLYNHNIIHNNLFAESPKINFFEKWNKKDVYSFFTLIQKYHTEIIAIILEPIVQGVGGMHFYHPQYLKEVKELSQVYDIPLIIDEIATGFGRTGKLFAYEHANIIPDILCIGKALTGGMMTLSATLTTKKIAEVISNGKEKCLMHGPTFMGNPLACAVAIESISILQEHHWKKQVSFIEKKLTYYFSCLKEHKRVLDVRVLGAICVIECKKKINIEKIQKFFVHHGVWIRPFKNLIYVVPAYIIKDLEIKKLADAITIALDYKKFFQ